MEKLYANQKILGKYHCKQKNFGRILAYKRNLGEFIFKTKNFERTVMQTKEFWENIHANNWILGIICTNKRMLQRFLCRSKTFGRIFI